MNNKKAKKLKKDDLVLSVIGQQICIFKKFKKTHNGRHLVVLKAMDLCNNLITYKVELSWFLDKYAIVQMEGVLQCELKHFQDRL